MTPPTNEQAGTAPAVVAFVRSLIIVLVVGALTGLVAALTGADLSSIPPEWRPLAGAALVIIVRTLEGAVDQLRGQAPQDGPLGSAPAIATAYIDTTSDNPVDPLPAGISDYVYGTDLTNAELRRLLAYSAEKLERRNAAPPPASPTQA